MSSKYSLCYDDGLNRFYLADEYAILSPKFKYPPGVFDDFRPFNGDSEQLMLQVAKLTNELSQIKNSKLWKATNPLRLLAKTLNFHSK